MTAAGRMQALRERIIRNLTMFERVEIDPAGHRLAGVAIVLSPAAGEPTYALTRRALTLRRGAGNWALPGGGFEPGEDAIAAARRETAEELGVALPAEAALGLLDDFVTLTGHRVTPVILWSPEPLALNPDPTEVGAVYLNPVAELDHPEAPRREDHPDGGEPILRMFASQGHWINPPTAAFLYQFREVALHGRLVRVANVGQPPWTAR